MKTRNLLGPLLALFLAVLASLPSYAQSMEPKGLPETAITETRVETSSAAVRGDVVVIDTNVLEQFKGRTLSEVISRNAGLQMSTDGGSVKQPSLFLH